ncbi:MAG TPA: sigma-70 family RNA polymerase sigma factor [Sphingomicrobium sp.]|nr:sigma-70 family RNA polymerase sigma factor [Sphingomicrobium sp.]
MKKFAPPFLTPRAPVGVGAARGRPAQDFKTLEFQRLILPQLDGAYNLARFLTRDPVLAEDVVQDAMIRAFRALDQFRGGSPRAWLYTIVRNCCRTAQAGRGGAVALVTNESGLPEDGAAELSRMADPGPTPHEEVERTETIAKVRSAVEAIPEPFREAVVLRDLEELSYAEIAEVTGAPVGTVMSRLARGRAMLAKELLSASNITDEQSRSVK